MQIVLRDVSKKYKDKAVLTGVNLKIPENGFIMLKGESGAGKTTLLNIIGGIEQPSSGTVLVDGKDLKTLSSRERDEFYRHKIGFIYQGFYLQPDLTIRENIELPGVFARMSRKERYQRAEAVARQLGIEGVLDSRPAEVSGGQIERTCIARALFMRPEVILADEPTNNLDDQNSKNALDILVKLQRELHVTVIISSHNPIVEDYAEQIFEVKEGKLL